MTHQPWRATSRAGAPSLSRHPRQTLRSPELSARVLAGVALVCAVGLVVLGSVSPGPFRYAAVALAAALGSLPWLRALLRRHGLVVVLPLLAGMVFSVVRLVFSTGNVISGSGSDAARYVSDGELIASTGGTSITDLVNTAAPADRVDQVLAVMLGWLGHDDALIFLFFGAATGIAATAFLEAHLAASGSHARWPFVLVCCVPSILLWSAAPSKESFVVIGLAAASIAVIQRSLLGRVAFGLAAVLAMWLVRPGYVPLLLTAGLLAYLWRPTTKSARSMHFRHFLGAGLIVAFVVIAVRAPAALFGDQVTGDSLGAVVAERGGRTDIGGSAITTTGGPLAAFGSLLRPFPWEAGLIGAVIFVEFLFVLTLVLVNVLRGGRRTAFWLPPTTLGRFSLALGLLLWLATLGVANLGIITRLRAMAYLPALGAVISYAASYAAAKSSQRSKSS